jgi:hypothetical protein
LTAFGIAAIVELIFSTIGKTSADGPCCFSYFFIYCNRMQFCSFAYAEFASMVPVSGVLIRIRMLLKL